MSRPLAPAPPVYRPAQAGAPPVYRPQVGNRLSPVQPVQMKMAPTPRQSAPPVYRPAMAVPGATIQRPSAPAAYRPMPPVQPKMAAPGARNLLQAKAPAVPQTTAAPRPYSAPLAGTIVQRVNGGKKPRKPKRSSDDDDDFVPPQGKKQKRYSVPKSTTDLVIRATAHRRAHYDGTKYRAVYTCPGCRRPIAYETPAGKIVLTRRDFRSKSNTLHKQRALQLDHFPVWAERERDLKGRGATDDEIRDDHNRPSGLRAICAMCNASHKYERRKKIEYLSDVDEEGYMTPDDEPCNKGAYKPFRFDPPPPPPGAGGITT